MSTTIEAGQRTDFYTADQQAAADRPDRLGGLGTSRTQAVAQANAGDVLQTLAKPDAVVFGETHRTGGLLSGGNFGVISTQDGSFSYFGTKPVGGANLGPLGQVGISIVGTNTRLTDEGGVGISTRIDTPAGDLLLFANLRQDGVTVGNLIDSLQGRGQRDFTVSVNLGAGYSVSDGAVLLLANSAAPGAGVIAGGVTDLVGADAWVGVGYRGTATFEDGKLKSFNIGGVEIPAGEIGNVLGNQVRQARNSPPLTPNFGSNALASQNDNIQYAFGQSPWQVGFSAIERDDRGATEIRNGTVDVRNHGNSTTALTEPVYELGVKYGALAPGQRITSNAQAGQVIDQALNSALATDQRKQALGQPSQEYITALNKLMNPYNLDFGSSQLRSAFDSFQCSGAAQTLTNTSRVLDGLKPLPVAGQVARPADYELVRGVFQGDLRWPADNPPQTPPLMPSRGFGI